jgi:hypothetical protein
MGSVLVCGTSLCNGLRELLLIGGWTTVAYFELFGVGGGLGFMVQIEGPQARAAESKSKL